MYDELVKRLRELQTITKHCGEQSCDECENRELCDKHDNKTLSGTYQEAADAIEELSMKLHGDEAAIVGMKREIERMVVSNAPNVGKWIPVTERLPKKPNGYPMCELRRCYYLVSLKSGCVESLAFDFDRNEWHYTGSPVIAWRPLPPPPKEE